MNHITICNPDGSVKEGINVANLITLYRGLLKEIPAVINTEDTQFSMGFFSSHDKIVNGIHTCGTGGCATGWGPFFGIAKLSDETWLEYSMRTLINKFWIADNMSMWNWCFAADWCKIDNSREGAGHRIKYLIEHGLPENWNAQMTGKAPLIYMP